MTYQEAFRQAMRECGDTEECIEQNQMAMNLIMPMPQTGAIPPGEERAFIEKIIGMRRKWKGKMEADPQGTVAEIMQAMDRHEKNN